MDGPPQSAPLTVDGSDILHQLRLVVFSHDFLWFGIHPNGGCELLDF